MFQSTPVIADGRTPSQIEALEAQKQFQSTPVIADGRTAFAATLMTRAISFNPRPSSLTGEPDVPKAGRQQWHVSIHARHR